MNKQKYCGGCRNDIYNNGGPHGYSTECWYLEQAEIVTRKEVPVSKAPPWTGCPIKKVLDCYNKPGYVYVDPERKR